ncbi:MerR family transcriptional regulator [Enterococcus sp. LJL90]
MSKYTTGEIAKLCNVSTRTIQFYDEKKILIPTEVSSSGRRFYTDDDVKKLQWICLLKSLGLKLSSIKEILSSDYAVNTLLLIINEQYNQLSEEIQEKEVQLQAIESIKLTVQHSETIPTELLKDIEYIMENAKKLKETHTVMIVAGLIAGLIEFSTLAIGIAKGEWAPFFIGFFFAILIGIWTTWYYTKTINYICPNCNTIFKPSLYSFIFAKHTFKTRRLKCPKCQHTSYCVETTDSITVGHQNKS